MSEKAVKHLPISWMSSDLRVYPERTIRESFLEFSWPSFALLSWFSKLPSISCFFSILTIKSLGTSLAITASSVLKIIFSYLVKLITIAWKETLRLFSWITRTKLHFLRFSTENLGATRIRSSRFDCIVLVASLNEGICTRYVDRSMREKRSVRFRNQKFLEFSVLADCWFSLWRVLETVDPSTSFTELVLG